MRVQIDAQTAKTRASATWVVPDDVYVGWVHVQNDAPRTRRDVSYDYVPGHVDNSYGHVGYGKTINLVSSNLFTRKTCLPF